MVGYSYSVQLNCQGSFPLEWPSLDHCQGPVGHGTSKLHEGENLHTRFQWYEFILAWTDILSDHSLQKPKHSSASARSSEKQDMLALGQFWCQNLLQYTEVKKYHVQKTLWSNARANVFPFFRKEDNGSMLFRWPFLQAHAILYSSFYIWLATV